MEDRRRLRLHGGTIRFAVTPMGEPMFGALHFPYVANHRGWDAQFYLRVLHHCVFRGDGLLLAVASADYLDARHVAELNGQIGYSPLKAVVTV